MKIKDLMSMYKGNVYLVMYYKIPTYAHRVKVEFSKEYLSSNPIIADYEIQTFKILNESCGGLPTIELWLKEGEDSSGNLQVNSVTIKDFLNIVSNTRMFEICILGVAGSLTTHRLYALENPIISNYIIDCFYVTTKEKGKKATMYIEIKENKI